MLRVPRGPSLKTISQLECPGKKSWGVSEEKDEPESAGWSPMVRGFLEPDKEWVWVGPAEFFPFCLLWEGKRRAQACEGAREFFH